MSVYTGDFLGFSLGGIHSSQLNITRVSNNDRYIENLTPAFKDQTTEVPGGDGLYYWRTTHSQQTFIIDFAFDDLREEDIRRLRQTLSFKGVQELIFDEVPYKKYLVKCQNPPSLKYIAFDLDGVTVYKGEGSINLVAYYPYGINVYGVQLNSYQSPLTISNIGDIETPVKIFAPFSSNLDLQLSDEDGVVLGKLTFENLTNNRTNDTLICIDTKTYLVEGLLANGTKSGNLYNKYLVNDRFFNLPVGNSILQSSHEWSKIEFNNLYY